MAFSVWSPAGPRKGNYPSDTNITQWCNSALTFHLENLIKITAQKSSLAFVCEFVNLHSTWPQGKVIISRQMKFDKYMDRFLYYGGLPKSRVLNAIDLIKR